MRNVTGVNQKQSVDGNRLSSVTQQNQTKPAAIIMKEQIRESQKTKTKSLHEIQEYSWPPISPERRKVSPIRRQCRTAYDRCILGAAKSCYSWVQSSALLRQSVGGLKYSQGIRPNSSQQKVQRLLKVCQTVCRWTQEAQRQTHHPYSEDVERIIHGKIIVGQPETNGLVESCGA